MTVCSICFKQKDDFCDVCINCRIARDIETMEEETNKQKGKIECFQH